MYRICNKYNHAINIMQHNIKLVNTILYTNLKSKIIKPVQPKMFVYFETLKHLQTTVTPL